MPLTRLAHGPARRVALVLLALCLSGGAAEAADKVRIMVGGVAKILYLPAKLAEQLGYFKDEGLDVELVDVQAGAVSETALLSGTAEAAVGAYEQTIRLQAQGKFVTAIALISACPQEALLVSAKDTATTSPAGLKGKTLGVTGFGSLTHFLSLDLLARAGLGMGDASFLAVGSGNTFVAAMQQGRIDAGMTQEPTVSALLDRKQARVLVDLRTPELTRQALGGDYPGSSLYVRADWLLAHKDVAARLSHAFQRALGFIAGHSAEQVADAMPPAYYAGDKPLYVASLRASQPAFTRDGRMPEDGPRTVLGILGQFGRGVQPDKIDLSRTYTNDLIRQ